MPESYDSSRIGSICRPNSSRRRIGLRWLIEMFFRTFKHNGVEIQACCAMIVCMPILIYTTGEKPDRAMHHMVWYYVIGLASLEELEAFITSRR